MVERGRIPNIRLAQLVRRHCEDLDGINESAEQVNRQFTYCIKCDKDTLRLNDQCTLCARVEYYRAVGEGEGEDDGSNGREGGRR